MNEKKFESMSPSDIIAVRKELDTKTNSNTIPVKLSSVGKLGLPAVIHVKDYSYSDAIKMASANTDAEMVTVLLSVLDNIIVEDIELDKLTNQDVLEILLSIQGTWYSPSVEYPYYVDDTLTGAELKSKENLSKATILINDVKTSPFPADKQVPIEVEDSSVGFSAKFDYPRFYEYAIVQDYIDNKYSETDNQMEETERKIRNKTNTAEEYKKYISYKEKKTIDRINVAQALKLLEVNGKTLTTIEEKLSALEQIPLRVWGVVNNYIEKDLSFGVDPEVTFKCTVTGKEITRRFPFRILDFLPTMESINNSRNNVLIR